MWRNFLISTLCVICFAALGYGQYRDSRCSTESTGDYLRGNSNLGMSSFRGLFDPSRMHMSNSMSMGYYSGGGVSASRGLYLNTIDYQISRPLSITTHLGYQFQPSGPAEWNPAKNGDQFVGGADLNWQPTNNANLRFSVYRNMMPESGHAGYYGWDPYGYRGFGFRP